jgi:hypothetical protein
MAKGITMSRDEFKYLKTIMGCQIFFVACFIGIYFYLIILSAVGVDQVHQTGSSISAMFSSEKVNSLVGNAISHANLKPIILDAFKDPETTAIVGGIVQSSIHTMFASSRSIADEEFQVTDGSEIEHNFRERIDNCGFDTCSATRLQCRKLRNVLGQKDMTQHVLDEVVFALDLKKINQTALDELIFDVIHWCMMLGK